jgi:hypothetical protein
MKYVALKAAILFLIILLAGYLITLFSSKTLNGTSTAFYPALRESLIEMNMAGDSITPLFIKNYSRCDPFTDKNMCILKPSLRAFLTTNIQKYQYMYVLKKLDEWQLPHELALLPIIESRYNPYAISSKGAAGIWQLMPKTARDYGLSNYERFELEASTRAALLILKDLRNYFGSWQLAIAAYNAGLERVAEALLEKPSAKSINDLNLPLATKKYLESFNRLVLADQ